MQATIGVNCRRALGQTPYVQRFAGDVRIRINLIIGALGWDKVVRDWVTCVLLELAAFGIYATYDEGTVYIVWDEIN
jgi:hypothetical protein